ncbi:MAG: zf-HC2 domain-containing protein [Bacteroidota bacterium]
MKLLHKIMHLFRPMMSCEEVNDFILDYLEGRLPRETKLKFEKHLEMCPCCVPFLDQYKQTVEMVATEGQIEVPADLAEHTLSFLREQLPSLQK